MVTRKLQFSGSLFDGRSAQKHDVRIELTPHHISLVLPDRTTVDWPYSDLRWAAETSPFQIEHETDTSEGQRLETLVVEDHGFYENYIHYAPQNLSQTKTSSNFNWKVFIAGILMLVVFFYGAFKIAPNYFVDQFANEIPIEWEETLGDAILSAFPVEKNPDPKVINLLENILRLLKQSMPEGTPYNLKIFILRTEKINALALPGGNIIIFEGLLKIADSPEELAGVLAHEAQHIFLKHSTQGILRNFASGMLLTLVMGDANVVLEGMINLAGQLNTLGLSRKMELEADARGMELMLNAKINPHGMVTIFEKLLEEELKENEDNPGKPASKKSNNLFSYLSTHPSAGSRLNNLKKQVGQNKKGFWIPLYPDSQWQKIRPKD